MSGILKSYNLIPKGDLNMQYLYHILKPDFQFFKNDFIFSTFSPKYAIFLSHLELNKKQQDKFEKTGYQYTIL